MMNDERAKLSLPVVVGSREAGALMSRQRNIYPVPKVDRINEKAYSLNSEPNPHSQKWSLFYPFHLIIYPLMMA